jgi:ATP dependent DNA ligase C terminal region
VNAAKNTLLVGFDSAWTPTNSGAIAGVLVRADGVRQELGPPVIVNYHEAEHVILAWQAEHVPVFTIVLLDQPTIVMNATGQRPVEHIVSSVDYCRYGGMQPANTAKAEMFGAHAPVWSFLARFCAAADPLAPSLGAQIFETYPVLTIQQLFKRFGGLEIPDCPFANLPEAKSGRWGQELTKAKMAECRWLKPVLVGQFEFLEWTGENHLRHTKFIGLREDKPAREVRRE